MQTTLASARSNLTIPNLTHLILEPHPPVPVVKCSFGLFFQIRLADTVPLLPADPQQILKVCSTNKLLLEPSGADIACEFLEQG
jgi:hypothetical protein